MRALLVIAGLAAVAHAGPTGRVVALISEVVDKGYLDKRTRGPLAQVPQIKAFGSATACGRRRTTSAISGSVGLP